MMKSRFLSMVGIIVLILTSMPANAAILKFEFSGDTNAYFGPVVTFSGSFLFDTQAPIVLYPGDINGTSYISRFYVSGGVFDFHAQLDGLWSLDEPITSDIGADLVHFDPGYYESFMGLHSSTIDIYFQTGFPNPPGAITTQQWMDSPDPVAEFFLYGGGNTYPEVYIDVPDNPDYPQGQTATSMFVRVTEVPIPQALSLFGSGLLGLISIARRKKAA